MEEEEGRKGVETDSQVVEEGGGKRVKGVWWREASYLGRFS